MIELLNSDFMVFLFPVLFTVAAFATRKDLAFVLTAANWLVVAMWLEALSAGWSKYAMVTGIIFANLVVMFVAGHHWYRYGQKPLARFITWTSWLAVLCASTNVFGWYDFAAYSLMFVQLLALIACFMADGHKELMNDVARWIAGAVRTIRHNHSHTDGGAG